MKSQTWDPQLKVPPGGLVLRFFCPKKIHRPQPGLNPRTLDLETSMLPLVHTLPLNSGFTKEIHSSNNNNMEGDVDFYSEAEMTDVLCCA